MALAGTGDALGAAMQAAVDGAVAGGGEPNRAAVYKALGNAIIAHFLSNGTGAIAVLAVQPGAGTAIGNIT